MFVAAGIIERVAIATRSGQVVLYQLTDFGRTACLSIGIESGAKPRESLEHRFWINRTAKYFEKKGYDVTHEHPVKGNGTIDILAQKSGEKVAIEIETGKSDIRSNLQNIMKGTFNRTILVATTGKTMTACKKVIDSMKEKDLGKIKLLCWLDIP